MVQQIYTLEEMKNMLDDYIDISSERLYNRLLQSKQMHIFSEETVWR